MWAESSLVTLDELQSQKVDDKAGSPQLVFCFGNTDVLKQNDVFRKVAELYPHAIHMGCSSGTAVSNERLEDQCVSILRVGFENTPLRLASTRFDPANGSRAVGQALGSELAAEDLVGVFVLTDGLNINGSELVQGLIETCGPDVVFSGGLAGDGDRFAETLVQIDGEAVTNGAVALGLYGPSIRIAHGIAGGWDEFGPRRTITASTGNVLYELDRKPALDLYERYLGEEAAELPASALLYPLRVWNPSQPEDNFVRTVLSVDRDERTMTFAGDIPEGWSAQLMRGSFDRLTNGAISAASHARSQLDVATRPQACLFVSCVGRRLLMKQRTEDEVRGVLSVLGEDLPLAGFYSYGELAPNNTTGFCGLHNQTATLTLLAEV